MPHAFRLETVWQPDAGNGTFAFTLLNLGAEAVTGFRLAYTTLTRMVDPAAIGNASLVARDASFHQVAPPEGLSLAPGATWRFTVGGLQRKARHCTDGAKSAYVTLGDGTHIEAAVSDLLLEGQPSAPPPRLLPTDAPAQPFALIPWPMQIDARPGESCPVTLFPAPECDRDTVASVDTAMRLHARLFPTDHAPFSLVADPQGRPLRFEPAHEATPESYAIRFSVDEVVVAAGEAGRRHALVTLAQLLLGARREPGRFAFPDAGNIVDAPRHAWRGCHLDVSRQFYPVADVTRLIDILAWYKLNIFHWHLTDDEAWRIEIKAFPELTSTGVRRGPDAPLTPQLGGGAVPTEGHYSQRDVRAVVAHAASLGIEVVPEIDIPGHNAATLVALPDLVDRAEAPNSYLSVQGFANNALNPALPLTYTFLEAVFDELVALFPSPYLHVGGDEVARDAWLGSPQAKALMQREGLAGTFELQAHLLRRVKAMLTRRGKVMVGWNEVAHGGGVAPEGTLLMAWETPEVGIDLARRGYDVVMTPGQAYYLDMVQDEAWQEPGASWAGTVPPAHSYGYEAAGEFPEELQVHLKGVQACIWSEHFTSRAYFNRLVFPRLPAVAEAAWTPSAGKDWPRFAAIAPLAPRL
ncbi:family 20 glycosylhydrolase [Lichenihabitans sp. Uapishka_5]|uniref:beta-N-acetylhexosaminidase n=1 Tax=Lichenihabitans sp. Uapishka_5 TaxID=3037302 RepID=UPI0029E81701|nr:family 20 glycosylhydrolase [Lichenihabitans sp. Uapishka_5]MDX7949677.1 family 20 glycosylhydrolase [Lichenihabitans sp. Uapishka_5]